MRLKSVKLTVYFKTDGLRNLDPGDVLRRALVSTLVLLLGAVDDQVAGLVDLDPLGGGQVQVVAVLLPLDQGLGVTLGRRALENHVVAEDSVGVLRHGPEVISEVWKKVSGQFIECHFAEAQLAG